MPKRVRVHTLKTHTGKLTFVTEKGRVIRIGFGSAERIQDALRSPDWLVATAADRDDLEAEIDRQFIDYLSGKRRSFTLPFHLNGTEFQKKVWQELMRIPYGETRSYRQIAEALSNPGASRAVGGANNRNPLPILIPCHRVIGADGSLTGYAGGLKWKKELLDLEKRVNSFGYPDQIASARR